MVWIGVTVQSALYGTPYACKMNDVQMRAGGGVRFSSEARAGDVVYGTALLAGGQSTVPRAVRPSADPKRGLCVFMALSISEQALCGHCGT